MGCSDCMKIDVQELVKRYDTAAKKSSTGYLTNEQMVLIRTKLEKETEAK